MYGANYITVYKLLNTHMHVYKNIYQYSNVIYMISRPKCHQFRLYSLFTLYVFGLICQTKYAQHKHMEGFIWMKTLDMPKSKSSIKACLRNDMSAWWKWSKETYLFLWLSIDSLGSCICFGLGGKFAIHMYFGCRNPIKKRNTHVLVLCLVYAKSIDEYIQYLYPIFRQYMWTIWLFISSCTIL